ncbi:MAG: NAD(P)-dependent oxidoreductase [Hydrogenophaga sp. SCN 70-13]|uniref:dTDP-4-dehydrorhamnose reductase family protein n=1 Tax=unclassified Hydrogenophaga TaxID=2610897 RepID=UPI000869C9E8|nr:MULTISPECIES: SDR family oxidoreductase [unclassified Hydrogenophaga]MBN9370262.1 SDR family oxidoreductase [Hydrogenophaga sp.]ODT34037.1 MAG: NAD(P)-dependent oxidoreductase [Hydrogenophaga sp. SCN 70-13]OJV36970.1 MAG: NAD(P)-dependent oxidoreductase [Hydrogenophaga sp. 70-12]
MNVLILGGTGMLGHAMFHLLSQTAGLQTWATVRSSGARRHFPPALADRLVSGVDVENADTLSQIFARVRPDVVINCIGLIKQLAAANDPLAALPINALLPHRLARLCDVAKARLIHVSTDCVFSGQRGHYVETDTADATDLYGRSKHLGEVDYPHTITLRTSIIGEELEGGANGLVGWFLSQSGSVKGFTRAIFSGLPTVELARVVRDHVLPRPDLHGLYHVATRAIAKADLLALVASAYGRQIEIVPDASLVIDRSLDASKFQMATGYVAPDWPALIAGMRQFHSHT